MAGSGIFCTMTIRDPPATMAAFSHDENEGVTERAAATLAGIGDTAGR